MNQSQRLTGVDNRSSSLLDVLQILRDGHTLDPGECDIDLLVVALPFHHARQRIVFQPPPQAKLLFRP
ncbi:MAG: hypothetical protein H0T47_03195 [Planctomycetaceae bacterium]|nr:hypothetical protein [Planctomycetaceae bacterium]